MTTPNPHLVQRLTAIQQALLAQRAGAVGLPNAVAGAERETFLREFLQKVFPSHRRFATGAITDANGGLSGQVDIAVEYGFSPSFPMPASEERLLLADSIALAIEVKSNLIAQWSQVEDTTKSIKRLERDVGAIGIVGDPKPPPKIPVVAVGYIGHTTIDGLSQRLQTTDAESRPDGALVIESGCFVGFGMTENGALGLYALAVTIDHLLGQLVLARPNLMKYVRPVA